MSEPAYGTPFPPSPSKVFTAEEVCELLGTVWRFHGDPRLVMLRDSHEAMRAALQKSETEHAATSRRLHEVCALHGADHAARERLEYEAGELRAALAKAEADLADSHEQVASLRATVAELEAGLKARMADLSASQAEVERMTREREEGLTEAFNRLHLVPLAQAERYREQRDTAIARERALREALTGLIDAMERHATACCEYDEESLRVVARVPADSFRDKVVKARMEYDAALKNCRVVLTAPSPACPSSAGRKCHVDAPECLYKHGDSECAAPCLGPTRHATCPSCEKLRGILDRVLSFSPIGRCGMPDGELRGLLKADLRTEAEAALAHAEGTHEERWARLGHPFRWCENHRAYCNDRQFVGNHLQFPTVAAVDEWIAARATHATKEGK